MSAPAPATALRRTKSELRRKGWTKGTMRDPRTGEMCMVGALRFAIKGDTSDPDNGAWGEEDWAVYVKCSLLLVDCIVDRMTPDELDEWGDRPEIIDYNDDENTKLADVIAVIDCAISKVAAAA